jgi:type II secretory pathway predicted ATPase ExeA
MYLSHYGLSQSPFGITPNPAFFYTGNKRGAILEALIYAVEHGEGIIKVTGEVGSGKTMLCRMLESMLPANVVVIYLVNPTLSREEVVYAIAGELGLATGGQRPDEVIRQLQSDLIAKHVAGQQVVLLIEEAQAMPLDTLEEIRLFSNLETAHHKLLQIVLFGQPELDESLNLPRMRQLKERITHSFKVPPMELEVIPEFLMFRMRTAGYRGPDIFSKRAIKLIGSVSEGVVRRISILADKSLLAAFADNSHAVELKHVKAAVEDSEFTNTATAIRCRKMLLASAVLLGTAVVFAGIWQMARLQIKTVSPHVTAIRPALVRVPPAPTPAAVPTVTAPAAPNDSAAKSDHALIATMPSPSSGPASNDDMLKLQLTKAKAWLDGEQPRHYTVQFALIDAANGSQITQYIKKIGAKFDGQAVHLYPTRVGGVARFGVLYGTYASRNEAARMRSQIASQAGFQAPQIRSIQGIRGEISRSRSDDLWP